MPGSILLPGTEGVSLAIGGFIKNLTYYDTNAENRGAIFFPSSLGSARDDRDGGFADSAELSRLNFDARAKIGDASLRGYLEFDFNGGNLSWRLGYLSWDDKWVRSSQASTGQISWISRPCRKGWPNLP